MINTTDDGKIIIVIDEKERQDYLRYYFNKYPRRKKPPIKEPVWDSMNTWTNLNREAKNKLKQDWRFFIEFIVRKYGFTNLKLDKVKIKCVFYFKTKHVRDLDNYSGKFCLDGFVSSGLLLDDNCEVVNPYVLEFGGYDKDNPRVEVVIEKLNK